MLRGAPLTVVIPARKGSRGIPGKNLLSLGGDTLLGRAVKIAKASEFVDSVIVSTDCEEMYQLSCRLDASMGQLRSSDLAKDDSLTIDVVLDALNHKKIRSGWVLLLQVTSPLRTSSDFNLFCRAWQTCLNSPAAMVSVVRHLSPHPDKLQIIENGFVKSLSGKETMVPRQSLRPVFALNGCFYITGYETLIRERTFLPSRTTPFVMEPEQSLNLDSNWDLTILQALVQAEFVNIEKLG